MSLKYLWRLNDAFCCCFNLGKYLNLDEDYNEFNLT